MTKILPIAKAIKFVEDKILDLKFSGNFEDFFTLKALPLLEEDLTEDNKFWLLMYFNGPANTTIDTSEDRIVHQTWELQKEVILSNKREDQQEYLGSKRPVEPFYQFVFLGYPEYGNLKYNNNILLLPNAAFHRVLKLYIDNDPEFRKQFPYIRGLENLKLFNLPNNEFGLSWNPPDELIEYMQNL